ncbi:MAG: exostosin family protein, partial [Actinomycetota bacterium]
DVVALPVHWDALSAEDLDPTLTAVRSAGAAGRRTLIWVNGDHELDLGLAETVRFQLAPLADRAGRLGTVRCYPPFIDDRLPDGADPARRDVADRPRVGFCGQATPTVSGELRALLGKGAQRVRGRRGPGRRHPEPWTSHVRLRRRVLDRLEASAEIDTDFVAHRAYRAGVTDLTARRDPDEPTNRAFRANIEATDYTVCIRGGGNFSTRLYETMALGRIPVIVDTGALLPRPERLDWDDLAVIVPAAQWGSVPKEPKNPSSDRWSTQAARHRR